MDRLIVIFIFAIFHYAMSNMTAAPRNTVVIAGERAELECRVDRNSTVYRWDVSKQLTIFKTETIVTIDENLGPIIRNISHFGVDVDVSGSGIIYHNWTELEDAGNYTCWTLIGPHQDNEFYSAQLIVLESLPNCTSDYSDQNNSLIDNEPITMQCNLSFRGFWSPRMQWTQHSGSQNGNEGSQLVKGANETNIFPNSHVSSSLIVSRNSLHSGTFFSCKIYFERTFDERLVMNATNVPDFVYVWNSSVFGSSSPAFPTTDEIVNGQSNLLWIAICVVSILVVVIVIATTVFLMKNKNRIRQVQDGGRAIRSSTSPDVIQSDENPECRTYDEINEFQISPVDLPPKTRPRLNGIQDYALTCIPQHDENIPADCYSIQDTSKLDQLDKAPGDKSPIKSVNESEETVHENVPDLKTPETDLSLIYHVLVDPHQAASKSVTV